MPNVFSHFVDGDMAPCAFCRKMLFWSTMTPSNFGPSYRDNVCEPCRQQEIENHGWMIVGGPTVSSEPMSPEVTISNFTIEEGPLDKPLFLWVVPLVLICALIVFMELLR